MILLKDSTVIHAGLCAEMHYALGVAAALKQQMFGLNCIVTSLLDGHHNDNSLHPSGRAADLRSLDLNPTERLAWFDAMRAALEPMGFDVIWEGGVGATEMTTAAHVHCEFDPHGRKFWHQL